MRKIEIDASHWTSVDDFYDAMLPALGAPDWHGRSLNALIDSIIGGGINTAEPPYRIIITGTASLDKEVLDHLETAKFYLAKARKEQYNDWEQDVDAAIEIAS